jgi:MFS family permease
MTQTPVPDNPRTNLCYDLNEPSHTARALPGDPNTIFPPTPTAAKRPWHLCWGFGVVTFETLMPVRLSELVGGPEQAARLTGPASSAAWLASAVGAALIPLVTARLGVGTTAVLLRLLHGVTVVGMGLLAGPVGVLTGFLACYLVHGAANPVHNTLLHREVTGEHRSTVMSMNSMAAQPAGSLGMIVLTALAAGISTSFAIVVGAVVLALAAPMYLPAARVERRRPVPV